MSTLYELRYRPEADPEVWSVWIDVGTSTSHKLTGLQPGTAYEVEVRAKGQTPDPLRASRWTRFAAPSAPTVSGVLAESATLTWAAVLGAAGYRVLRGGVPVSAVTFSESDGVVTAQVSGLTATSAQSFTVAVLNPDDDVSAPSSATATETLPLATGGTISDIDVGGTAYRVHTFTSTGESTFTLNATRDIEYLIVGGGGGGGGNSVGANGGGGAGGLLAGTIDNVQPSTITVTVGAGGIGATGSGAGSFPTVGQSSSFGEVTADGGGAGGSRSGSVTTSGGSGGGGSDETFRDGGAGKSGQGNDGGKGSGGTGSAAGGGGAGATGADAANDGSLGGAGGEGLSSSITGTETMYAGGGGGGARQDAASAALGGAGGGGSGGSGSALNGGDGVANTGGGGGGGGRKTAVETGSGGNGGSGIVIVRYRL